MKGIQSRQKKIVKALESSRKYLLKRQKAQQVKYRQYGGASEVHKKSGRKIA